MEKATYIFEKDSEKDTEEKIDPDPLHAQEQLLKDYMQLLNTSLILMLFEQSTIW